VGADVGIAGCQWQAGDVRGHVGTRIDVGEQPIGAKILNCLDLGRDQTP